MIKRIFSFIIKSQYFNLIYIIKSLFIFIILSLKLTVGANAEEVKKKIIWEVTVESILINAEKTSDKGYNSTKNYNATKSYSLKKTDDAKKYLVKTADKAIRSCENNKKRFIKKYGSYNNKFGICAITSILYTEELDPSKNLKLVDKNGLNIEEINVSWNGLEKNSGYEKTIDNTSIATTGNKYQFCLKAPKFGWLPNEFFDIETRNKQIISRSKKYDCEIVYEDLDPIIYSKIKKKIEKRQLGKNGQNTPYTIKKYNLKKIIETYKLSKPKELVSSIEIAKITSSEKKKKENQNLKYINSDNKFQYCLTMPQFQWGGSSAVDLETNEKNINRNSKKYNCEIVYENTDPIFYKELRKRLKTRNSLNSQFAQYYIERKKLLELEENSKLRKLTKITDIKLAKKKEIEQTSKTIETNKVKKPIKKLKSIESNEKKKNELKKKKAEAEARERIAKIKIEEEEKRIAKNKAEAEERERIAKIKIEEEEKRIAKNKAEEDAKNQKLISSNKENSTSKSRKKNKSNSRNFLEALAKKEVIEDNRKKIIRYECQQSWDLTTEDYRPLLDIYELDLRDRTLKGTHRYITDKEYTDERVYPILATDKDRVLVRYDSPNGNFSTKFFFNYGTDQSIIAADNSYKTKSKCVNRDYFVDIKIAKKNVAKADTSNNDLKALELAKKEAILAKKEIEKIENEQEELLANQNKILKNQEQKIKTTKVVKLKIYDDPKKLSTSVSASISKSQFKKYNAKSTVSYLFFESSENYLISLELLYRAYDLNTDADKIRSHIAYMKESKSSEKNRLSSTRQIVRTQSIVISDNIKNQSLQLSEQGKIYYAQSLPYALNAAISTYNLYHVASNTIKNVGGSGDVVFSILNDLNNIMGIATILPEIPGYSINMYKTTKLIISGAKVRKIKDSTNVNKALNELNLET